MIILFYLDKAPNVVFSFSFRKKFPDPLMYFQVLAQRLDDIMDVEPHKLVLIFVDFNTKNIILENEDTEIGDLRNQTTKAFKFKSSVS